MKYKKRHSYKLIASVFLTLFLLIFSFQTFASFSSSKIKKSVVNSGTLALSALDEETALNFDAFLEENENEKEGELEMIAFFIPSFALQVSKIETSIIFPRLDPVPSFHGTSKFILALALRI